MTAALRPDAHARARQFPRQPAGLLVAVDFPGAVRALSLFAEFIANDRPLLVSYQGHWYFPVVADYTERNFGGDLPIAADYRDKIVASRIERAGWMIWPPIPFSYRTINFDLGRAGAVAAEPGRTGSAPTTRGATCWRG